MTQQSVTAKVYAYISSAWVELDHVAPISTSWGLPDNKPETRLADIGELSFALNNATGVYTPGVTAGWGKGIPVKLVLTYDSVDYVRFRGMIETIRLERTPGDKKIYITALDWMDYASKYPIINPDLLTDTDTDTALTAIVDVMPVQPQARSFATAITTYPTVFDTVRGNTKAYTEFAKLAKSEPGYIYKIADKTNGETLVFEASDTRNGTRTLKQFPISGAIEYLLTESGDYLTTEDGDRLILDNATLQDVVIDDTMTSIDVEYGENIINRFTTNAYPKRTDTEYVLVYESERDVQLNSGETKTFRVFWRDPTGKRSINAIPPTGNSFTKSICHFDTYEDYKYQDELGQVWSTVDVPLITNIVKFGQGAAYFDGSTCYLTTPDSPNWDFGTSDFCVEWWEYRFSKTSGSTVFSRDATASYPAFDFGRADGTNSKVYMSSDGANWDIANGKTFGAITTDVWAHYAVTRDGSTFRMFKNGTQTDTWTSAAALVASSSVLYVGRNGSTYLTAVIDEIRITKGSPVYTAAFTAPTEPFVPEGGTRAIMTSGAGGTGTDITDACTVTADYGTEGATITVNNTGVVGGYLRLMIYAYGIYSDSPIEDTQEDTASINIYGYQNEALQQSYQQDLYTGILEGKKVIEYEKLPRMVLNKISLTANSSEMLMAAFLNVDVGDLVHIKNDKHNIDSYYYVQGIEANLNGGIVSYTWIVKQAFTLALGLSLVACEFAGGAATDAIDYGYLPIVSGDAVTHRVFSAWVYLDAAQASKIFSPFTDDNGLIVYAVTDGTNSALALYSKRFAVVGSWQCSNALPLAEWAHILVDYDHSSTSNDPAFYYNGVLKSSGEAQAPSGAAKSEVGTPLIIGNWKTATQDYDSAFDGKIKDARIYDMGKTSTSAAALAAALYAEGAGGTGNFEGMVFQAFAVRTAELSTFEDMTLTDEKLLESYNGCVGTPNGSPVVRLIP